jgi:exodeoxyribonuclease V alpha subunit
MSDPHVQFATFFKHPVLQPLACLLSQKLSEGHICLQVSELPQQVDLVPEEWQSLLTDLDAETIAGLPLVGSAEMLQKPFILHGDRLYLQRYFKYETDTLKAINKLISGEAAVLPARITAIEANRETLKPLFDGGGTTGVADWQSAAVLNSALQNFAIITGGPGTGKTTTVARLLALLFTLQPTLRVALAAPTGKAATRMAESLRNTALTGFENLKQSFEALKPTTIHRLLKSKVGTPYFRHNGENPVPYDVVIADESSMIDVALFAKMLCAIGPATRLFLLGDKSQLASVEAGSIFGDLCTAQPQLNTFTASRRALLNSFITDASQHLPNSAETDAAGHLLFEHVVELQTSYRFTSDAGIGRFSKAIIAGDTAGVQSFVEGEDNEVTIDTEYDTELFEKFVAGYAEYICEPDIAQALKKFGQLRVLCAQREGPQGLYTANKDIEQFLLGRRLLRSTEGAYENRPIILTKNLYSYELFNGDTGIIRPDKETGNLMAWFEKSDGSLVSILPGYLTDSETAFALTVHKSQGSEFDSVLLLLPAEGESPLLTRELLYTAVTRAKSQMFIQGPAEVLKSMTGRAVQRASGLGTRF